MDDFTRQFREHNHFQREKQLPPNYYRQLFRSMPHPINITFSPDIPSHIRAEILRIRDEESGVIDVEFKVHDTDPGPDAQLPPDETQLPELQSGR